MAQADGGMVPATRAKGRLDAGPEPEDDPSCLPEGGNVEPGLLDRDPNNEPQEPAGSIAASDQKQRNNVKDEAHKDTKVKRSTNT